MADVMIIGAGPAGLSAAVRIRREGLSVQVFEGSMPGGQLVNAGVVDNVPGILKVDGYRLASNMLNQAAGLGAEMVYERAEKVTGTGHGFSVLAGGTAYEGKALILAPGVVQRKLAIPGAEELAGKGVSYCVAADAGSIRDKDAAIVGGGNAALSGAAALAGLCRSVYLIHRREQYRADAAVVTEALSHENVVPILSSTVTGLVSGEDGKLSGVTVRDKDGREKTLAVSGLFVSIGQVPDNEMFRDLVELDENGYIRTCPDLSTSRPGVFAAGDGRAKDLRELTGAIADGTMAASAAAAFVRSL